MRHLTVEATHEFLERLIKTPLAGVVEIVWNALDADATEIRINVQVSDAGGVETVVIEDNGTGMSHWDAEKGFGGLGNSWKKGAQATLRDKRQLHGRLGQGRYAVFGIGEHVVWYSVSEDEGKTTRVRLSGSHSKLQDFEIGDPEETTDPVGTRVQISVPTKAAQTALLSSKIQESLTAEFALYLSQYEQVQILWNDEPLDPKKYIKNSETYELAVFEGHAASVTVVEWTFSTVDRALYLCDANGMTLGNVLAGVQAKDLVFTAYLKWERFREIKHDILLADTPGHEAHPVLEAARDQLRIHYRKWSDERRKETIQRWRSENVYPFDGEPQTEAEVLTRKTFDLVALSASKIIDESKSDGKRLALRLIREATETSPTALRRVLEDVVGLSDQELEDFGTLLDRTNLSNILQSSRTIADRLDFVSMLHAIIYERDVKRRTLERNLHKLLEAEAWIFGNEWSVATSDQRLTASLVEHIGHMGNEIETTTMEPVKLVDGNNLARTDLLLWRAAENQQNRFDYLVVELKRPSLTLTEEHLSQIKRYALAVSSDTRFNMLEVKWDFWLIGDKLDPFMQNERKQQHLPPGVVFQTPTYRVHVRQWSEILANAEHRLRFVESNLQYESTRDDSIARMREKHRELLATVFPEGLAPAEDAANESTEDAVAPDTDMGIDVEILEEAGQTTA